MIHCSVEENIVELNKDLSNLSNQERNGNDLQNSYQIPSSFLEKHFSVRR
jgi:hypothetical protein